jgi:phage portal protein BeeE
MTKLWRSLARGRTEERNFPDVSMADWMGMFTYNGLAYNLTGTSTTIDTESAENSFIGYVNSLYKSSGIVFACVQARASVFSDMRFQYQKIRNGRPGDLFGTPDLSILENPWPNGTTGELLTRALQDIDLAGNHFVAREPKRLRRLRPDWVQIVLSAPPSQAVQSDVVGYMYWPGGIGYNAGVAKVYMPEEVAHWSPVPDPEAQYRGMSWLTPVLREIQSDKAATAHKANFFANAATPNMAVSFKDTVTKEQFKDFIQKMETSHTGTENAYKTLYLGGGADVTVLGTNMQQMDFAVTQGAGEVRIAAAAGVHPVILGLSEALKGPGLNGANFSTARSAFGDGTLRPLWRSLAASYQSLVPSQPNARLWYDDRDIAFLRTDRQVLAQIQTTEAATISTLISAGYEPDSIVAAITAQDWTLLEHTGLVSVQLNPPGTPTSAPDVLPLPPGEGGTPALPIGQGAPALPPGTPTPTGPAAPATPPPPPEGN